MKRNPGVIAALRRVGEVEECIRIHGLTGRGVLEHPLGELVVGCEEERPPEQCERLAAVVVADRPFQSFERLAERDAVAMIDSTEGGSAVIASPLTTAPGVPVSSRT